MFSARSYLELGLVPLLNRGPRYEVHPREGGGPRANAALAALTICYGLTKLSSLYCAAVIGLRSPSKSLMM